MSDSADLESSARYDVVVWGATGFVGKLICEYLLERYSGDSDIRWAMAARSTRKLDALKTELGSAARNVPVIVADAADPDSLSVLVQSTRVVLSTVGPYAIYGAPLVEACAQHGTDYVDLAGETQWIRRMIDAHQETAAKSGARIVPCCGFDSIPSDLGVFFLQSEARVRFGAPIATVKMRVKAFKGGASGGTLASMVNIFQEAAADEEVARILRDPYSLNPADRREGPRQPSGMSVGYDDDAHAWTAPFVMAAINTRVVQRTNALLDPPYADGFLYDEMMLTGAGAGGWATAWATTLGLGAFAGAASVTPLRSMLTRFVLTAPGDGPDEHARNAGFYDLLFFGETDDGKKLATRVTGDKDPGYGSTAKVISEAALCLAKDISAETTGGGLWTPASAMGGKLIARLEASAGLAFTVCN
jgi:short subunit dehydrogenase-like uncharacterized protein